jgi:hypothetical protein
MQGLADYLTGGNGAQGKAADRRAAFVVLIAHATERPAIRTSVSRRTAFLADPSR